MKANLIFFGGRLFRGWFKGNRKENHPEEGLTHTHSQKCVWVAPNQTRPDFGANPYGLRHPKRGTLKTQIWRHSANKMDFTKTLDILQDDPVIDGNNLVGCRTHWDILSDCVTRGKQNKLWTIFMMPTKRPPSKVHVAPISEWRLTARRKTLSLDPAPQPQVGSIAWRWGGERFPGNPPPDASEGTSKS